MKSLAAAALTSAVVVGTSQNAMAKKDAKEKCYGIVKAGKNDCGANGHSCAGVAEKDRDPHEWILLPAGLCDRIAGGSTEKPKK